jgi:hypothetical protein
MDMEPTETKQPLLYEDLTYEIGGGSHGGAKIFRPGA